VGLGLRLGLRLRLRLGSGEAAQKVKCASGAFFPSAQFFSAPPQKKALKKFKIKC
jgi:hypothetical protein